MSGLYQWFLLRMKTERENTGKFRFRFLYFSDHFRIFGKIRKRDENGTVSRENGTGNGSIRIPTVFGIHGKIRNIPGFYPGFSLFFLRNTFGHQVLVDFRIFFLGCKVLVGWIRYRLQNIFVFFGFESNYKYHSKIIEEPKHTCICSSLIRCDI